MIYLQIIKIRLVSMLIKLGKINSYSYILF